MDTYFVYVLCSEINGSYYVGQTQNLIKRLERHNAGYVVSTRRYKPWSLIGFITKPNRGEAQILERKLKNLSRVRLEKFIEKYAGPDDQPYG